MTFGQVVAKSMTHESSGKLYALDIQGSNMKYTNENLPISGDLACSKFKRGSVQSLSIGRVPWLGDPWIL